nr:DUF87 domain-containing protein [uncultured Leptotrichia sp.]
MSEINALVTGVMPNKIKISIKEIKDFTVFEEKFRVGSYLRISDSYDCAIIGMVETFMISQDNEEGNSRYLLEAVPIGFLNFEKKFIRGGNNIAIPPTDVKPARKEEIQAIFNQIETNKRFCFASLLQNIEINVPVDGDKFFNKHFAIVGSTGSGKSHTVAKILQKAKEAKNSDYQGLNNSHIVVFDIHSEYKSAFPDANYIDVSNLNLPYWLMNGEELEELFVESGENQAYNQINILRKLITVNKQMKNPQIKNIFFDTSVKFSIEEILNAIINLSKETRNAKNSIEIKIKEQNKIYETDENKFADYFEKILVFEDLKHQHVNKGTYNDGSLEKFIERIKNKLFDKRLRFLFDKDSTDKNLEEILRDLIGYNKKNSKNITIIDLSGVPFEVLSITVSLISRLLFEFGYYLKQENLGNSTPLLLVYEEAHKYVPKIKASKYNSSRIAIERIAKEGRKYGITLAIVSQRPSEISETIFSQCNNFITMRLTNPQDQSYVEKLLPDNIGNITNLLSTLGSGEALIIGDSIIMPSAVKIEECSPEPNSKDINYFLEWKKQWNDIDFKNIVKKYENK